MARRGAAAGTGAGALTQGELSSFILFAGALFGVLGVVNLLRPHKRWLGASNVFAALAAALFSQGAGRTWVVLAIVAGLACIALDAQRRVGRKSP